MPQMRFAAALLLCLPFATQAQTQVCGWMIEKLESETTYTWDIWLQSDAPLDFFYKMSGAGVISETLKPHAPGAEPTRCIRAKRRKSGDSDRPSTRRPSSTSSSNCSRPQPTSSPTSPLRCWRNSPSAATFPSRKRNRPRPWPGNSAPR